MKTKEKVAGEPVSRILSAARSRGAGPERRGDHSSRRPTRESRPNRSRAHRELRQTMAILVDQSKDGYVLSGLATNQNGDRGDAIGKKFTRLKKAMGFDDRHVFHSIRKTVVTILRNAGAPEDVVADIVGHKINTMTYGLYSGEVSLAVKRETLDKLAY